MMSGLTLNEKGLSLQTFSHVLENVFMT